MCGQETAARRLNLDVIVPRAAGGNRRHNGAKTERAVGSGDDMAPVSEAGVVVFAPLICMPEIDHRPLKRAATTSQHEAGKFERTASGASLAQVTAFRRFWLEKRSLGLARGRFIAIATGRCERKLLRERRVGTGKFPPRGKDAGAEQKSATARFQYFAHQHNQVVATRARRFLIPGRYCEFKYMFKQSYVIARFTEIMSLSGSMTSVPVAETVLSARASNRRSGK